jgi:hypothetical protein
MAKSTLGGGGSGGGNAANFAEAENVTDRLTREPVS